MRVLRRGSADWFVVALACAGLAHSAVACGGRSSSVAPSTPPPELSLLVTLEPESVVGGASATGSVTLSAPAPANGLAVSLSSSQTVVTLPTTVMVAPQQTRATFTLVTGQVIASTPAVISATAGSATASRPLTLRPLPTCGPLLTEQVLLPFAVFVDNGDETNHFVPSGFFGDAADITLSTADTSSPRSGSTAIRIEYRPRGSEGFAGVFWQCPEKNWGTVQGAGFNLSRARQVRFWARASAPARSEFKAGGIGRGVAPFPDSFDSASTNPVIVELGTDWRQFTIELAGRDLSRVIGGFMWVTSRVQNPAGVTVFIDDVVWQ
jgi:hypothetical protein